MAMDTNAPRRPVPLSAIVAANVRAETARRRLNQTAVARILGLSKMSVSDRFRGRVAWSVDELEVLADTMGLEVTVFMLHQEGSDLAPGWLTDQGAELTVV